MIKGRGRNLDSAALRCLGMCRKHPGNQFALVLNHEPLILQGIASFLFNQLLDLRLCEKEFVKPGNLRDHLQISKILLTEISFGSLRRFPATAETLPQLSISRITPDEMDRVRLKQILQGE